MNLHVFTLTCCCVYFMSVFDGISIDWCYIIYTLFCNDITVQEAGLRGVGGGDKAKA